jgi:hypothetical protein
MQVRLGHIIISRDICFFFISYHHPPEGKKRKNSSHYRRFTFDFASAVLFSFVSFVFSLALLLAGMNSLAV